MVVIVTILSVEVGGDGFSVIVASGWQWQSVVAHVGQWSKLVKGD